MPTANRSMFMTLLTEPFSFLGGLLFFLMAFSPAENVAFKMILIGIILVTIIVTRILFDRISITKPVFIWYALLILHGVAFTIIGFINKNSTDYILRSTTYNIVWPFVYFLFTIGIYKKTTLKFLMQVIVIAHLLISLYLIGGALTLLGVLPKLPFLTFEMTTLAFDSFGGIIKVQAPSITTLVYTLPFVISLSLLGGEKSIGFSKLFVNISILVSILAVLATVRRALILNIFLGFVFTFLLLWLAPSIDKKAFGKRIFRLVLFGTGILTFVIVLAEQFDLLNFQIISDKFLSAFSGGDVYDASTAIRYEEFGFLVRSWLQKPWFGFGHGAASPYVIRSEKTPWIYELSYIALLFQTGIIGLGFYILLLGWPIYKGIVIIRKADKETCSIIIPCLVGCICFLIANATNPYLQAYDFMWALFLPVAVINYYLRTHD